MGRGYRRKLSERNVGVGQKKGRDDKSILLILRFFSPESWPELNDQNHGASVPVMKPVAIREHSLCLQA